MQENVSAAVRCVACRTAICEANDFTFTWVKFQLCHM